MKNIKMYEHIKKKSIDEQKKNKAVLRTTPTHFRRRPSTPASSNHRGHHDLMVSPCTEDEKIGRWWYFVRNV